MQALPCLQLYKIGRGFLKPAASNEAARAVFCAADGADTANRSQTYAAQKQDAQKQMAAIACAAISGTVFSAPVRPSHTRAVGLSILLLVSVCLGDSCVCIAWHRVPQAKDLDECGTFVDRLTGRFLCCPAAWERGATRWQHTSRVALRVVSGAVFAAKFGKPVGKSVIDRSAEQRLLWSADRCSCSSSA